MSPKTIGIDARMLRSAGIGRYIQELLHELVPVAENPLTLFVYSKDRSYFDNPRYTSCRLETVKYPIYSAGEQIEMWRKTKALDFLHTPHLNIPIFRKKMQAVTVHDLIYLTYKPYLKESLRAFYVHSMLNAIARKKMPILTVSDYSKNVLLEKYPKLDASRITVSYEAASDIFRPIKEETQLRAAQLKYKLDNPFVLFVGSLRAHKNLSTLVAAMRRLKELYKMPHDLVLVGAKGVNGGDPFVKSLGQVPDEDLARLYSRASVFVIPSYEEGFGLPLLEAMSCGAPVIYSNRASLPEIASDAGLSFDPLRADAVDALCELLYNVLKDNDLRIKMTQKGLIRAKSFSWKKTAQITLDFYKRVLNEDRSLS